MKLLLLLLLTTTVYADTTLKWNAPGALDFVQSHTVNFGTVDGPNRTQVVPAPLAEYIFKDDLFDENNNYCFKILATNKIGSSQFSEAVCKDIIVKVPKVPTGLRIE